MKNKFRLILLIPLIVFFFSIILILFSPVKFLPCETSITNPATSWNTDNCKGYYITTNENSTNVNDSGFIINLVILVCSSFLINGILFLVLSLLISLKNRRNPHLDTWEDLTEHPEDIENFSKPKKSLRDIFFKKTKI